MHFSTTIIQIRYLYFRYRYSVIWQPRQTGAYDEEECAARAYDLAALKYWGTTTFTNFPV